MKILMILAHVQITVCHIRAEGGAIDRLCSFVEP